MNVSKQTWRELLICELEQGLGNTNFILKDRFKNDVLDTWTDQHTPDPIQNLRSVLEQVTRGAAKLVRSDICGLVRPTVSFENAPNVRFCVFLEEPDALEEQATAFIERLRDVPLESSSMECRGVNLTHRPAAVLIYKDHSIIVKRQEDREGAVEERNRLIIDRDGPATWDWYDIYLDGEKVTTEFTHLDAAPALGKLLKSL